jgi:transcription antitermination protein NusB
MGARTGGREAAIQVLFGLDIGLDTTDADTEQALAFYWREFGGDMESRAYAEDAVRGVMRDREALDRIIAAASQHWRLERMARIDRNVLRLGTWELSNQPEVPRAVILDEAVELAKRFGSEESSSFVNGVLNQVADNLGRADLDR